MLPRKSGPMWECEKIAGFELVGSQSTDFSASEFHDQQLHGQNFFESIFNGCVFKNLKVQQSIFQHAEFTETDFGDCTVKDTSFDHSDFVLTNLSRCSFLRCSFQNAEWRDSTFHQVKFQQCIFRNTTTSLTVFSDCNFDRSSASSFVGNSKRFSIFSGGSFYLPKPGLDFLRLNFGIVAPHAVRERFNADGDPLFELSLRRYEGTLLGTHACYLIISIIDRVIASSDRPNRLRIQYTSEICRMLLKDKSLSIFTMGLLEKKLSEMASSLRNRDQALQFFSLLLTLRSAKRERIAEIETEVLALPENWNHVSISFCFEETFQRPQVEDFAKLLANFCTLPIESVSIQAFQLGSTYIEMALLGSVCLQNVFRFIKYSLSMATVTLTEGKKLKRAYAQLKDTRPVKRRTVRSKKADVNAMPRNQENIVKEILGEKSNEMRNVEVFVDRVSDRVLVVDGRVRITINLS